MAADGRNDARGAARLLAHAAKECVENPNLAPAREVALNNVYRLLEAYKTNALFGHEPLARRYPQGSAAMLTLMPAAERHVVDVREAMEQAVGDVFANQPKKQAIESVESVLRAVVYPQNFGQPSEQERTKVANFFDRFLQHLQTS
jgi:hypothetical protein